MELKEIDKPAAKIGMVDNEDIASKYLLKSLVEKGNKEVTIISKEGGNTQIINSCIEKGITDLYIPLTNTDWLNNSVANSLDKLKQNDSGIRVHTPLLVHDSKEIERLANEKGIEPGEDVIKS